jgi:lipopolysaccharide export system permease protein
MFKLLDRLLICNYLKAYLICLVSLLGLYIVVDLFTNMDDFAHQHHGLLPVLRHIVKYYGIQVTLIFDRLCEVIVLLAAMFTVAWVQRNNELVPLLSAGVSTHRMARPVLLCACLMMGLSVVNTEFIIPQIGSALMYNRDDPDGDRDLLVTVCYEPNGVIIWGQLAQRREMLVREFSCSIPPEVGLGNLTPLQAKEARYIPPGPEPGSLTGGWLLTGTTPAEQPSWTRTDILKPLGPGKYFLYTDEVDFEAVTRHRKWFYGASTLRLFQELGQVESNRLASMAVLFHMRLTRPILGIILVVLGLSVILRDQNRNIFISAGLCVGLCALFFAACFGCKFLGDTEFLSPALAAWLPVLVFGSLSFAMFDAIHT